MENKVIMVKSEADDILELKDNLRREDIEECRACGHTPMESLMQGYAFSDCYSAKKNGKTIAMFGVSSYKQPHGFGVVWFLGSDEVFKHPITLVKGGREYTDKWFKEGYKVLYNAVDKRNTKHINWLIHLGFIFTNTVKVNGYDFLQFYKRSGECVM